MFKHFLVEKVENGYTVGVTFVDGGYEVHIATTDAKLKKLIKAILTIKPKEVANAN